jgi:hypothetical protein
MCRPYLEASGCGVVEIMTSNHAYARMPGCFPYNVAKTALAGLVRSLAVEWGPKVRVVGLAPGFIETPGNSDWFDSFPDPAVERERTTGLHPAGRLGTCDEIGAWSAFLASDFAAFATGATYVMDGGGWLYYRIDNCMVPVLPDFMPVKVLWRRLCSSRPRNSTRHATHSIRRRRTWRSTAENAGGVRVRFRENGTPQGRRGWANPASTWCRWRRA